MGFLSMAGFSEEQTEQLMGFIEKYLTTRLYKMLFCPLTTDDEEKDLRIQNRIRSLNWVTPLQLDAEINDRDPVIREKIDQAITGKRSSTFSLLFKCIQLFQLNKSITL